MLPAPIHNCKLLDCSFYPHCAARSNFHDVYADLLRDISRREKIRRHLQLDVHPTLTAPAPPLLDDAAADEDLTAATLSNPFSASRGGIACAPDEIVGQLPATFPMPFPRHRVRFADRLGVFLTDGERRVSGDYPPPDDGVVTLFSVATLIGSNGKPFRLRVKHIHYGKPRFPFVEIATPGTPWYGRVWLMFSCKYHGVTYNLALISYLTLAGTRRGNTTKQGYVWSSPHPECVELNLVRREITMVSSFVNLRAVAEIDRMYHLVG